MKICVLIPTKNGIDYCNDTIKSIIENSSKENEIEILLKIDINDENYINDIHRLQYRNHIKMIISKEEFGSGGLHLYLNEMYKITDSDWILTFNDDSLIVTKNWDILLKEFDFNEPVILHHTPTLGKRADDGTYYFSFISRKYLEITKRISTFPFYDGYLLRVAIETGIRQFVSIQFDHRLDMESKLNGDQVFGYIKNNEYENDILTDIEKIKTHLNQVNLNIPK